jgi:hypothetical protein
MSQVKDVRFKGQLIHPFPNTSPSTAFGVMDNGVLVEVDLASLDVRPCDLKVSDDVIVD